MRTNRTGQNLVALRAGALALIAMLLMSSVFVPRAAADGPLGVAVSPWETHPGGSSDIPPEDDPGWVECTQGEVCEDPDTIVFYDPSPSECTDLTGTIYFQQIVTIPSAFTATTGKAHWEVLVRARAVETQCYVLAPAQHGRHDDGGLKESHGHSLIVDPWGQVLAQVPNGTGIAIAEVDLDRVAAVRRAIPLAAHRRAFL